MQPPVGAAYTSPCGFRSHKLKYHPLMAYKPHIKNFLTRASSAFSSSSATVMYARNKVAAKKKQAPGGPGVSAWGPRIALIEREKQRQCPPEPPTAPRRAPPKGSKGQSLSSASERTSGSGASAPRPFYLNPTPPTTGPQSISSTETWRSSCEDLEGVKGSPLASVTTLSKGSRHGEPKKIARRVTPPLPPPEFSGKSASSSPKGHPGSPQCYSGQFGGSVGCRSSLKSGSVIAVQGLSQVYVPIAGDSAPGPCKNRPRFKFDLPITQPGNEECPNPDYERIPEQEQILVSCSHLNGKDSDGDSLLGSCDSNLFQPKRGSGSPRPPGTCGASSSGHSSSEEQRHLKQKRPPPPLPPKNTPIHQNPTRSEKSIRFCGQLNDGEGEISPEMLSCGHTTIPSGYSTLSSTGGGDPGQEDAPGRALQQLRDLSILIGGSFCEEESKFRGGERRKNSNGTDSGKGSSSRGGDPSSLTLKTPPDCSDCPACAAALRDSQEREMVRKIKLINSIKIKSGPRANHYCAECHPEPSRAPRKVVRRRSVKTSKRKVSTNRRKIVKKVISDPIPMADPLKPFEMTQRTLKDTNNLFTIAEEGEVYLYNQGQRPKDRQGALRDCSNKRKEGWEPKCWLSRDPTMGWSDLESLYGQTMTPPKGVEECYACWKEFCENRRLQESNTTVDRTKRMFIWLSKRQRSGQREFNAPWWEAKKRASISWLVTKALDRDVPKGFDPFKPPSKEGNFGIVLKDPVSRGLTSGKLYFMALNRLYSGSGGPPNIKKWTGHWDVIQILARKGLYVAKPSDMRLTEGTLKRKPIRIATHVALIEALMGLYTTEVLSRERVLATLRSFGHSISSDFGTHEELMMAWINAAVFTLKSYVLSSRTPGITPDLQRRWIKLPKLGELRDLCDGIGICSLFALYCSSDLQVQEIYVPEPGEFLGIFGIQSNHSLVASLASKLLPERVGHMTPADFLYIHTHMKQNTLSFLVDLYRHLEVNPVTRVNRLTNIPLHVEL